MVGNKRNIVTEVFDIVRTRLCPLIISPFIHLRTPPPLTHLKYNTCENKTYIGCFQMAYFEISIKKKKKTHFSNSYFVSTYFSL